jgi:two-component system, OmpR family, phosphate regulon sensor histidine kinase PhoR
LKQSIRATLFVSAVGLVLASALLVYAFVPSQRGALPLSLLFGLMAAVAASAMAGRVVSRAAEDLTAAARGIAAGKWEVRTQSSEQDPLGELGRALDSVAQSLASALTELTEERDRLRGVLAGMEEGVLLLDEDGRIALLNTALREMLLLGADAVGKTQLEAIRHADLKRLLDQARTTAEPATGEIELGGLKPRRLLVRAARLPGREGQVFAVFVDVTDVRKLESMRRDFVANVSHELRTPVTAIRSAAETLQTGIPDDPRVLDQFIGIIARNAERLHDLVEDLLDLSRIESQKLKLAFEPLELRAVFAQVLSLFRERADRKRVELVNEVAANLPRVVADRRALEHVVTNLVDNAVKYCGEGSRVMLRGEEHGSELRMIVTDDGPGIAERHLPRLFERFYRVDAGRSRELGGTGLGLSIVKHLVEAMEGSVGVQSVEGQGTTFTVTLKKAGPRAARAVA